MKKMKKNDSPVSIGVHEVDEDARGRTCQARNHDWNEILRVTDNLNSVLNEMWFFDH